MKKILFFIGLLISLISSSQGLPPGFTKINQKYMWTGVMPPDTTNSKYGLGAIGDSVYWGNGTRWINVSRGSSNSVNGVKSVLKTGGDFSLVGDSTTLLNPFKVYGTDSNALRGWQDGQPSQLTSPQNGDGVFVQIINGRPFYVNASSTPLTGVLGTATVIDLGNLNYLVTYPQYKINGVLYPAGAQTITLPVGSANPGEGRIDWIVLNASGAGSVQGDNSATPAAKEQDGQTYIYLSFVLINEDEAVPATPSLDVQVYDDHIIPPEFTVSSTGTITYNADNATNLLKGTKNIAITAMNSSGHLLFTYGGLDTLTKTDYTYLIIPIRVDATINAASNYTVQIGLGTTFSNAIQVTAWSIPTFKTASTAYKYVAIPMSEFTGNPKFKVIRFNKVANTGTVNLKLDDIKLQKVGFSSSDDGTALIGGFVRNDTLYGTRKNGTNVFMGVVGSTALQANEPLMYPTRISTAFHTAFGVSVLKGSTIITVEAEGLNHELTAGTKPAIFITTNRGKTNSKIYLPLTGITGAASNDIRNFSMGIDATGIIWIMGADYQGASEATPCKIWYWKSSDGSTWTNPVQITYNTTTYSGGLTPYGSFHDYGTYIEFPAYGSGGGGSYGIMFKSLDRGVTWTAKVIRNGNTSLGSNYVTETDVIKTTGTNLIAFSRREGTKPFVSSSADDGETWTSRGTLRTPDSILIHCPILTKEGNEVFAIWANRVSGTVEQTSVVSGYTDTAVWNAQPIKVIASSIIQTGFGAIDFGYPSIIGTGQNRILSYYDLGLLEPSPADINPAITDIIFIDAPVNPTPQFSSKVFNTSVAAGAEDDIVFDRLTRGIDNAAMLQTGSKLILIPEDGLYEISGGLRFQDFAFGAKCQLSVYRYNSSDVSDFTRVILQDIREFKSVTPHIHEKVYLRKGNYLIFRIYNGDSITRPLNNDDQPFFSITKVKQ